MGDVLIEKNVLAFCATFVLLFVQLTVRVEAEARQAQVTEAAASQKQTTEAEASQKQAIKAVYIPLADHYPGVVAYEKYRHVMKHADFQMEKMSSWDRLRAAFEDGLADVAFVMSPLAMEMYSRRQNFRWVSLLHRDGNALAVNERLHRRLQLSPQRKHRKPDPQLAKAIVEAFREERSPLLCGVPDLLSTHAVVLYKYLKDNGVDMHMGYGAQHPLIAITVPPPKTPLFLKQEAVRHRSALFEQSLPWADVVETQGYGHVVWYSKDVIPWEHGHVECIVVARDETIAQKKEALKEVIHYLHLAGRDIEEARESGGRSLEEMSALIRRHIPEHNQEAIVQSLRADLGVINYKNLNIDHDGLRQIMNIALEAGILKRGIDIQAFADPQFSTSITVDP